MTNTNSMIISNPNNFPTNISDSFKLSAMRTMHLDSWNGSSHVYGDIPCCIVGNNIDNTYISMTAIARAFKPDIKPSQIIRRWMRTKTAIQYLTIWENEHGNINFNMNADIVQAAIDEEYEIMQGAIYGTRYDNPINKQSYDTANVNITPQKWIRETNATGIICTSNGVFAHHNIALEFAASLSAALRYYINTEFERLKEMEYHIQNSNRALLRDIVKQDYNEIRRSIEKYIAPYFNNQHWAYAREADMINRIVFGFEAKVWRAMNPERARRGENVRDDEAIADPNFLLLLDQIQRLDTRLICSNLYSYQEREEILTTEATRIATEIIQNFNFNIGNGNFINRFSVPQGYMPMVVPVVISQPALPPITNNVQNVINNTPTNPEPMCTVIVDKPPMNLFKGIF